MLSITKYYYLLSYVGPTNSKDDTVRLVDTQANGSGVLEVMVDGKWRGVCGRKFSLLSGVVACRELGYASIER